MGVNMYDQAAQMPIINTYVPINFGELYKIALTQKSAIDDANKQLKDTLTKYGEFVSPSEIDTQKYYDLSIGKLKDDINDVYNNPDLMKDAAFRAKLNSKINNLDYKGLSNLKRSRDAMLQRLDFNQKLVLAGKFNPQVHSVDFTNYDTLNSKIYDDVSPMPWTSTSDWIHPYVNDLKESFVKKQGNYNISGVSRDRILRQVDQNRSDIEGSANFAQHKQAYMNQGMSEEQAYNQVWNDVITAALEKEWYKREEDKFSLIAAQRKDQEKTPTGPLVRYNDIKQEDYQQISDNIMGFASTLPNYSKDAAELSNRISSAELDYFYNLQKEPDFATNSVKQKLYSVYQDIANDSTMKEDDKRLKLHYLYQGSVSNGFIQPDKNMLSLLDERAQLNNRAFSLGIMEGISATFNENIPAQSKKTTVENVFNDILTIPDVDYGSGNRVRKGKDSEFAQMWTNGLMNVTRKVSKNDLDPDALNLFGERSVEYDDSGQKWYSIPSNTSLYSPKEFIFEAFPYVAQQANGAIYKDDKTGKTKYGSDIFVSNTTRPASDVYGDKGMEGDLQTMIANGKIVPQGISDIVGYIPYFGGEAYLVNVKVALEQIEQNSTASWYNWYTNSDAVTDLNAMGYSVDNNVFKDSDGVKQQVDSNDGRRTVTVPMVVIKDNSKLNTSVTNRLYDSTTVPAAVQTAGAETDNSFLLRNGVVPGIAFNQE